MNVVERINERHEALKEHFGDFRVARHHPDDEIVRTVPPVTHHGRKISDEKDFSFVPWIYSDTIAKEKDKEYNHRAVMPTEVVWESDDDVFVQNLAAIVQVYERLIKEGIKAGAWPSAGKSVHLHAFFKPVPEIPNVLLQRVIRDHYGAGIKGLDKQILGGHLIRMEYGLHEDKLGRKQFMFGTEDVVMNDVPAHIISTARRVLAAQKAKQLRDQNTEHKNDGVPSCIESLFTQSFYDLKDGVNRGCFLLAMTLTPALGTEESLRKIREWNEKNYKRLPDYVIRQKVAIANANSKKYMSCVYRHQVLSEIGIPFQCGRFLRPDDRKESIGDNQCVVEKQREA